MNRTTFSRDRGRRRFHVSFIVCRHGRQVLVLNGRRSLAYAKRSFHLPAVFQRFALALAICALGALPVACGSGASSLPSAVDPGTRIISSGGSTNTGGGGGGGGKAPVPGFMAFTSGCGTIDSVSNAVTTTAGLPQYDTITTKVAEHNCVNIYFKVDFVNTTTGQSQGGGVCFNFTTTPYSCAFKIKTAAPSTTYQTVVTVWDATLAGPDFTAPIDPSWILATETLTVSTANAPPPQGT
jgi:LysM repeat protein